MASRIHKTPTHVILFRVTAKEANKLVHTMQLIDISNPLAKNDPKQADLSLISQETHIIRLPIVQDPSTSDTPHQTPEATSIDMLLLNRLHPPFNPAEISTGSPKQRIPRVETRKYHEILDCIPDRVWRFSEHGKVFNYVNVTYKISYNGVDIFYSPQATGLGMAPGNFKLMEANTRNYEALNSAGHEKPRFGYRENRLDLAAPEKSAGGTTSGTTSVESSPEKGKGKGKEKETDEAPKTPEKSGAGTGTRRSKRGGLAPYELFKGKILYKEGDFNEEVGIAVAGTGVGGFERWAEQDNVGWSGWRILLKEGQGIPDWYEEEFMGYNADDVLIWQALEVSRASTKWLGLDDRL